MTLPTEERDTIKKITEQPARDDFVQAQLKLIREASTGPAMNHYAVNDALDRLAVLFEKKPESEAAPAKSGIFGAGPIPTATPIIPVG